MGTSQLYTPLLFNYETRKYRHQIGSCKVHLEVEPCRQSCLTILFIGEAPREGSPEANPHLCSESGNDAAPGPSQPFPWLAGGIPPSPNFLSNAPGPLLLPPASPEWQSLPLASSGPQLDTSLPLQESPEAETRPLSPPPPPPHPTQTPL